MAGLRGNEWLIILLLALLLFGGKRLPDLARGIGRSLRIFKSEMKADDESADSKSDKSADSKSDQHPEH